VRASPEQFIHGLLMSAYLLLWIGVIFLTFVVWMTGLVLKYLNKGASFRNLLIHSIPAACSVGLLVAVCIPLGVPVLGYRNGFAIFLGEWYAIELLILSLLGSTLGVLYGIAISIPKFKALRFPTIIFTGCCVLVSTLLLALFFFGKL